MTSWAASKAVDHGSSRRALRAYFLSFKSSRCHPRGGPQSSTSEKIRQRLKLSHQRKQSLMRDRNAPLVERFNHISQLRVCSTIPKPVLRSPSNRPTPSTVCTRASRAPERISRCFSTSTPQRAPLTFRTVSSPGEADWNHSITGWAAPADTTAEGEPPEMWVFRKLAGTPISEASSQLRSNGPPRGDTPFCAIRKRPQRTPKGAEAGESDPGPALKGTVAPLDIICKLQYNDRTLQWRKLAPGTARLVPS